MQLKSVLAVVLLGFVVIALVWAVLNPAQPVAEADSAPVAEAAAPAAAAELTNGVIAYYLHPENRCATCLRIEELSRMAIEDNFPEELGGGRLQWVPLNVDQPANKHLMDDFELHTTSLVLVQKVDGETVSFKNCTRVWELVHSPMKFDSYLATEIAAFLGDA